MNTTPIRTTLKAAVLTATVNVVFYQAIEHPSISTDTRLSLGFVTLVVLGVGIYWGLRTIRYRYARPVPILHNLGYGALIALGSAIAVILLRITTTALGVSAHASMAAYFSSYAPVFTLVWYYGTGVICSLCMHFIIEYRHRKTQRT